MKYAIIGAGGTGGILGFYMTKADRDVTLIARGRHLAAMQEKGLAVEKMWDGTTEIIPVKAMDMEHYDEQPDVVLVCVKGYSLEDTIPFIQRVAKPSTIVICVKHLRNRCQNELGRFGSYRSQHYFRSACISQ